MKYINYLFILIFCGCSHSDNTVLVANSGHAQGSYYHIKYMSDNGYDYHSQIDSILQEVDSSLSIYQSFSLISKLNNKKLTNTDSLFKVVFLASKIVFNQTHGYFDCSISPLVNHYGFYNYTKGDSIVIDSIKVNKLLSNTGFQKINLIGDSLVLPKDMRLDFNALAQGYTVDLIANFLNAKNVTNYLIEVGGELIASGLNSENKLWRIGIDKPIDRINNNNNRFQFILDLDNKALATSGNYRKYYEKDGIKYSHTIDPFTGFPAQNNLLSVTVIHDDCMFADAYATALMVMGVEKAKQFAYNNSDIEIYLVFTDNDGEWKTYISPGMSRRIIN